MHHSLKLDVFERVERWYKPVHQALQHSFQGVALKNGF